MDIVHPQQNWQVKTGEKSAAFVQISLYQPTLQFGISSIEELSETEWQTVWQIWQQALSTGIGCRVSAGYGQPQKRTGEVLYRTQLRGRGQAAKLIDGTAEFRPNVFRAAIRGHALRLFGGLTNAANADRLVEQLFGGVQGKGTVGLLSMGFRSDRLEMGQFGRGSYAQPTYAVEGELTWLLTRSLPDPEQESLRKLIAALTRFAVVLGGFSKSWRRADHRLFLEDYYDREKPLIGCHWEWLGDRALTNDVRVRKLEKVSEWITETRQVVQDWMALQGVVPSDRADWREAWHPDTVEVWGRLASDREDSLAIHWLHHPYREAIPTARIREGSIYQSSVTGQMSQIGRLWHRMYPLVRLKPPDAAGGKPTPKATAAVFGAADDFPRSLIGGDRLSQFSGRSAVSAQGISEALVINADCDMNPIGDAQSAIGSLGATFARMFAKARKPDSIVVIRDACYIKVSAISAFFILNKSGSIDIKKSVREIEGYNSCGGELSAYRRFTGCLRSD